MSIMAASKFNRSTVIILAVVASCVFLVGCQEKSMPGGDSPVTTQRLAGSRLTDIREELSWTFDDTTVIIENKSQPIPPDVVEELLGNGSAPMRIEATWHYDNNTGQLRLSDVTADYEEIATQIVLPVTPAGHVRINLGGRQYNLFRNNTKNP